MHIVRSQLQAGDDKTIGEQGRYFVLMFIDHMKSEISNVDATLNLIIKFLKDCILLSPTETATQEYRMTAITLILSEDLYQVLSSDQQH